MKTFRLAAIALAVSLCSPFALAQTAPAKPAAKAQPKPAAKAPASSKPKLMTRDELRACMDRRDASQAESKAIEDDDKQLVTERDDVLKLRDQIKQKQTEIETAEAAIKADNQTLLARYEELKNLLPKMGKKEQAEAKADYEQRANVVNAQIDPHNERKKVFLTEVQAFEQRIDDFNKRKEQLGVRIDKLGDEQDAWRSQCGNRAYDEADEIALKKERTKAAGK